MPSPVDVRLALQRVGASCEAVLRGEEPPPVSDADLVDCEMAFRGAGLLKDRAGSETVKILLARELIAKKIAFATEYRLPARAPSARGRWFKADIVVLREFSPTIAVECKGYDRQIGGTRQRQNYARCGTPAMHVGPQTVSQAVTAIVAFLSDATPIPDELLVTDVFVVGGKGAHVQEAERPLSNGSKSEPQSSQSPTSRSDVSTPRTTWLTPYYDAYTRAYGEPPRGAAIGRMARTFKELETATPRDEVARRFVNYVLATPARFYSVEHFASTFPAWTTAQPVRAQNPADPLPGEDIDSYINRQANRR